MQYAFDPDFAPTDVEQDFTEEVIGMFTLPDNSVVKVCVNKHIKWMHNSVLFSIDRDGNTYLSGQGHSVRMFREVIKCARAYLDANRPKYILFAYRKREGRERLYMSLSERILWGTHMRWIDDPWDDFYCVDRDVLKFLDMVKDEDHITMQVIQRLK